MGLTKFDVDVDTLKQAEPERTFRGWIEDWEKEWITVRGPTSEAKLLTKYKGMVLHDIDFNKVYTIWHRNLEWRTKSAKRTRNGVQEEETSPYTGWYLIGETADGDLQAWAITDDVCDIIASTPQTENVLVIKKDAGDNEGVEEGEEDGVMDGVMQTAGV